MNARKRQRHYDTLRLHLDGVEDNIRTLADDIEAIGEKIQQVGGYDPEARHPDAVACYASNSLQGTLSLLRELRALMPVAKTKGKKR